LKLLNKKFDLEKFWLSLSCTQKALLMFDYDGTLSPFVEERDKAYPYPGVRDRLRELLNIKNCKLVIITGRETKELKRLLGLNPHPEIWGCHGLKILYPTGKEENIQPMTPIQEESLKKDINWCIKHGLKNHLEIKTGCIAFHTRGIKQEKAKSLESSVKKAWSNLSKDSDLIIKDFDGGVEIRVPGSNKAFAVNKLVSRYKNYISCYLGDDLTDEDAFLALKGKGLCVLVRKNLRETSADLWIVPPEELLWILDKFISVLKGEEG